MFERYTEKARRVIFFARYEASQYGSRYIETEHLLLGLLREERGTMERVLGLTGAVVGIRAEIEKVITKGKQISTSVEIPLSQESKKVLLLAAEEADRLAHRYVGGAHLLLGLLGVEGSLAARILLKMGVNPAAIRERLAKDARPGIAEASRLSMEEAEKILGIFLACLESGGLLAFVFAKNAQFIDAAGKRWVGREEIAKNKNALFAAYAKRDGKRVPESIESGPEGSFVASILWENVIFAGETRKSMHRMTVVLAKEGQESAVFLVQVTPVVAS